MYIVNAYTGKTFAVKGDIPQIQLYYESCRHNVDSKARHRRIKTM